MARDSRIFNKFIVNDEREKFLKECQEYIEGLYFLKGTANFQAAGHAGSFRFEGTKLRKKTKIEEVNNYQLANSDPSTSSDRLAGELRKLKHVLPTFFGAEKETDKEWWITIENALSFNGTVC